jgi:hypothetical protein
LRGGVIDGVLPGGTAETYELQWLALPAQKECGIEYG